MIRMMSYGLLRKCLGDRQSLKALAFALMVKSKFKSSRVHNFTYTRASSLFGISRQRAKEAVTILLKMGLCHWDGPHMMFSGVMCKDGSSKNLLIQNYRAVNMANIRDIEKFLRLQMLRWKQSQIDYAVSAKKDTMNPKSMKKLRSARARLAKTKGCSGTVDGGMPIATAAKTISASKRTAGDIITWGANHNLLEKHRRTYRVGISPYNGFTLDINNSRAKTYCWRGFVYVVLPNRLIFKSGNQEVTPSVQIGTIKDKCEPISSYMSFNKKAKT